ncbi:hypothetical protein ACQ9BO_19070 [Flavobacterium sp. P21]|uniref:hypothetical protein n=1 Tax=Flavobacterium sp. P21 TaxID=3423948 RepID=UPI003D675EAA
MKKFFTLIVCVLGISQSTFSQKYSNDKFPDGTEIPVWFKTYTKLELKDLGKNTRLLILA